MRRRLKRTAAAKTFRFAVTNLAIAVAAFAATEGARAQSASKAEAPAETEVDAQTRTTPADDASVLSEMVVTEDAFAAIANESTGSSIGFTKPILDTPRTVSFVSSEQIALLGISSVDDLTRVVPGTYTTTRYGLQGGINVRGVAADQYWRGMKRINMQGHARTSLAAIESIEVIKGPPSPIFGMGKIGGYSNLTPKSGRAKVGSYLEDVRGFAQLISGSYDKTEASTGAGGPMALFGKRGGYYVYGLVENSDSFTEKVGIEQRLLQASASLDDVAGPFRLEVGTQLQNSITSGAYMNRVTQDLIDHGTYITGQPLINLDSGARSLDPNAPPGTLVGAGDGAIGFRETHENSPIFGTLSGGNRPLSQSFTWPDCGGVPCPVGQFPKVAGIPVALFDYLTAHPEADPTGLLRAQGPGGPKPGSATSLQQLPLGFFLDPRTVGSQQVDYRANGSYERVQDAKLGLIYIDLINDEDPDFTIKNQFFRDELDSFKNSYLPYGERQNIRLWEDKLTVTRRIPDEWLPEWLRVNTLSSLNYRETYSSITSSGGDFDHRQDVMFRNGDHSPNTIFWNQLDNNTFETGAPQTTDRESEFSEMGLGLMFDIDLYTDTNLVLGARIDGSEAEARDFDRFNENSSNATTATFDAPRETRGWDKGTSWSASVSHKLPWGLRPYFTKAKSSLTLDSSNNGLTTDVVNAKDGHIGEAELTEFGVKGGWLDDRVFLTVSNFKQTRTDVSSASDPTAGAEVSSTETKGIETELKLVPFRNASIQAYAIFSEAKYIIPQSGTYQFTARELGFQDVVDPNTGKVIYPAEAFFYGGRVQTTIPAAILEDYNKRNGTPETQAGLNANYTFENGFGVLFGGTWFSDVYVDRLERLRLPEAAVVNTALSYDRGKWHFKFNAYNLFDELYFRGGTGDTNTNLVSVLPGRRYELTAKFDF